MAEFHIAGLLFYDVILDSAIPAGQDDAFAQHIEVAMFRNSMPRYEILSADAIATLDKGWRRIVSEIGVQFAKPDAVELFRKAGQRTDGEIVYLDPDFVLEQVALAPREFDV